MAPARPLTKLTALPAPLIIVIGVAAAVGVNLIIYALGVLAGGSFVFTSAYGPARVGAAVVAGFTAVPLTIGLVLTAIIGRWWRPVFTGAAVVASFLALSTIFVMTVPSDHDLVAKVTLGLCHVALVPVTLIVLAALSRRRLSFRT